MAFTEESREIACLVQMRCRLVTLTHCPTFTSTSECYAPNGYHSHKPIQCALSADSQIISVFAGAEEIENVEVKLLDAGVLVYALHRGRHDWATDELWAAFFKLLLDERLVPRILLSCDSPAFEWAKRRVIGCQGSLWVCTSMHSSEGSLPSSFLWFSRMQCECESNSTPLDGVCKPIGLDKPAQRPIRASKMADPDTPGPSDNRRSVGRRLLTNTCSNDRAMVTSSTDLHWNSCHSLMLNDICICTGEKVDAGEMRFHETVIPMEESYYDHYPEFALENGKWVYNAALVLTPENVQDYAFVDLKVRQLPKRQQEATTSPPPPHTHTLTHRGVGGGWRTYHGFSAHTNSAVGNQANTKTRQ